MNQSNPPIKMPEIFVFLKALLLGGVIAGIARIGYIVGGNLAVFVECIDPLIRLVIVVLCFVLLIFYTIKRGVLSTITKLAQSKRLDLLIITVLGALTTGIPSLSAQKFHEHLNKINPQWILLFVVFVLVMISSSLIRAFLAGKKRTSYQRYFLTDDEIKRDSDDFLSNQENAVHFAKAVLENGSDSLLIYGIDGPWGVGKTSFVNLACNYWKKCAAKEVVIVRFEPLRYASDPNLAERLIRDLSAAIQRQVFVPEFRSTANRYSRMLKGKVGVSFLGFNLSLDPSTETIDELLDDINDVLKKIGRRLIIVVDDLDRLDAKAVNDVLFTVRRTFKLTQATYILCYDTENLVISKSKDETEKTREFLEKFINIKHSLFVDSSKLCDFLRKDWKIDGYKSQSIPAETMLKLASILSVLADLLDGDHAATYMRLIGDMRKLKRFVNAVLLMQIEKTNFARTDFDHCDLINLLLLHLNYPGIFRRIYVEETEGKFGIFSIKREHDGKSYKYKNANEFSEFVNSFTELERFLLDQLFRLETLELDSNRFNSIDEDIKASRACFNDGSRRNLENYLKLIVRFVIPEPRSTFRLYQNAVDEVVKDIQVKNVLTGSDFNLKDGNLAHNKFWQILVNQSHTVKTDSVEDAIDTLVEFLPKYSLVEIGERGLRTHCIYNLIILLDRAGAEQTNADQRTNTGINIAHRIYGENKYKGNGLIDQLVESGRGVLGLHDLIVFRLQCSADRNLQVRNLYDSLVLYQNENNNTTGLVSKLALLGMRALSQRVFAIFKERYIDKKRNIFDDIDAVTDAQLLGDSKSFYLEDAKKNKREDELRNSIEAMRSLIKTFIIYQLTNKQGGTGSGVGCGYYDQTGDTDGGEISMLMNKYIFDVCFNPEINERNVEHFLDYCLCNLTSEFWEGGYHDPQYLPIKQNPTKVLGIDSLANYWRTHGAQINSRDLVSSGKRVTTWNYVATYAEDLPRVFKTLDELSAESVVDSN